MKYFNLIFGLLLILQSCTERQESKRIGSDTSIYLDYSNRDDILSGGVKMIPIQTSAGEFNVWTKRVGNNPTMKVLLLHGGPGATHEYFEAFDDFLQQEPRQNCLRFSSRFRRCDLMWVY